MIAGANFEMEGAREAQVTIRASWGLELREYPCIFSAEDNHKHDTVYKWGWRVLTISSLIETVLSLSPSHRICQTSPIIFHINSLYIINKQHTLKQFIFTSASCCMDPKRISSIPSAILALTLSLRSSCCSTQKELITSKRCRITYAQCLPLEEMRNR
jgi:hypothetical protein